MLFIPRSHVQGSLVDPPSKLQHPQPQLKMHDMKARATGNVRLRA